MINVYIPSYKEDENLLKSIESVNGFNIIVVDNNSGSEYNEVLNKIKDRCTVIKNSKNLGRVGNWKACIEHFKNSEAEWMKWLFTGDTLVEDAKIKMEEAIAKYPEAKIITFSYNVNYGNDNLVEVSNFNESNLFNSEEALKYAALKGNWFSVPIASMIHKDAVNEGYSFGEIPWVADMQFGLNIINKYPIAYIPVNIGNFNLQNRKYFLYYQNSIWAKIEDYVMQKQALEKYFQYVNSIDTYEHLKLKLENMFINDIEKFINPEDETKMLNDSISKKLEIIDEKFSNNSAVKCLIWGAGNGGLFIKNALDASPINYNILAFVDLYKEGKLEKIDIIKPEEIKKLKVEYIFIATSPGKQYAESFLKNMKFKKVNDFISLL